MVAFTRRVVGLRAPQADRVHLRRLWRRERGKAGEPNVTARLEPSTAPLLANGQRECEVKRENLPLSCPMLHMPLWNSHPRVYLPIEETGWAICPYCSAEYRLHEGSG